MNIHIITVAYGLPEGTEHLLATRPVGKKHTFHWHLFLHSQIEAVVAVCDSAAKRKDVSYYPYGENRGLARSWNEGILEAREAEADVIMIANDDVLPGKGDIDAMAEAAVEWQFEPQKAEGFAYMVTGRMYDLRNEEFSTSDFGMFALNPIALDTIGMFDEQFFPIYFEDKDYAYRAHISGLHAINVESTEIIHQGSGNINALPDLMEQNHKTFEANKAYYVKKWGGEPGQERFKQPFDDLRFCTRIAPCDRGAPYWGFERDDYDLVRM